MKRILTVIALLMFCVQGRAQFHIPSSDGSIVFIDETSGDTLTLDITGSVFLFDNGIKIRSNSSKLDSTTVVSDTLKIWVGATEYNAFAVGAAPGSASGAPASASYLTKDAEGGLSAEHAIVNFTIADVATGDTLIYLDPNDSGNFRKGVVTLGGGSGDSSFTSIDIDTLNNLTNASTTNIIVNDTLVGSYFQGNISGTASALAANGTNASAGMAILGVDASGNAEGAFDVWTEAENTSADYVSFSDTTSTIATQNDTLDYMATQFDISGLSGEWTDTGSILHPNEETVDEIAIGGTTEAGADIFLGVDGAVVFNEQGNDADFRVEVSTSATGTANPDSAFFIDGATGRIGIGDPSPANQISILPAGDNAAHLKVKEADGQNAVELGTFGGGDGYINIYDGSGNKGTILKGSGNNEFNKQGGDVIIGGAATASNLRLLEPSGSGTNYSQFVAQAQAANVTYTLPPDDGDAGEQLQTDGSGSLTWASAGGGGSATADSASTGHGNKDFDAFWPLNFSHFHADSLGSLDSTNIVLSDDIKFDSTVTMNDLTASRLVATDGSQILVNTITGANLNSSVSDETVYFHSDTTSTLATQHDTLDYIATQFDISSFIRAVTSTTDDITVASDSALTFNPANVALSEFGGSVTDGQVPDLESLSTSLASGGIVYSDGSNLAVDATNLSFDPISNRTTMTTLIPDTVKINSTQAKVFSVGSNFWVNANSDAKVRFMAVGGIDNPNGAEGNLVVRHSSANGNIAKFADASGNIILKIVDVNGETVTEIQDSTRASGATYTIDDALTISGDFDLQTNNLVYGTGTLSNTDLELLDDGTIDLATESSAGNWKVFYSDGSGVVTELALGTSGQVLKSNGATAAPSFQADATGGGGSATADSASTDHGNEDFDKFWPLNFNAFHADSLDSKDSTSLVIADDVKFDSTVTMQDLTASRLVATDGSQILVSTITGDNLNSSISDETVAFQSDNLSVFSATTSTQFRGVLSDESGTGVFLTANGDGSGLSGVVTSEVDPTVDTADEIEAILTNDDFDFGTGALTAIKATIDTLDIPESASSVSPSANTVRMQAVDDNGITRLEYVDENGIVLRFTRDVVRIVKNVQGSPITKGQLVYVFSGTGTRTNVKLAQSNSTSTMPAIGMIISTSIADDGFGLMITTGLIEGIKTDYATWAKGEVIWVSSTSAGDASNVKPTYPNLSQSVGVIEFSDPTSGRVNLNVASIFLGFEDGSIQNTYTLGDQAGGTKSYIFDGTNNGTFSYDSDVGGNFALDDSLVVTGNVDATKVTGINVTSGADPGHTHGSGSITETDPIVGAITGLVKADGGGNISAAVAGTDYLTPTGVATVTNKTLTFSGNTLTNVMSLTTAQSVTAGIKKTFSQSGTTSGFSLGNVSGSPSAPAEGDVWYNSTGDQILYRQASNNRTVMNLEGAQTVSGAKTYTADNVNTAFPWADNEVADNLTHSSGSLALEGLTLTSITDTELLIGTGVGTANFAAMSGDATLANTGALTIAANAVTSGKINNDEIVNADINSAAAIAISKTALVAGTNITLATNTLNVDDAFVINNGSDAMTGTLTADGLTLGSTELITIGAQTLTHNATDFVFDDEVTVPDDAYAAGWNGDLGVPTKNAVYDKIETISAGAADSVFQNLTLYDTDTDTIYQDPSGFSATNTQAVGDRVWQIKDGGTELAYLDSLGNLSVNNKTGTGNFLGEGSPSITTPQITDPVFGDGGGSDVALTGNGDGGTDGTISWDISADFWKITAPSAAPADGDLANGSFGFWIDDTGDEIEVKAKTASGDVINATIGSGGGITTTAAHVPLLTSQIGLGSNGGAFWDYTDNYLTNDLYPSRVLVFNDDGNSNTIYVSFKVPADYASGATLAFDWAASSTANQLVLDMSYRAIAAGESGDPSTAQETISNQTHVDGASAWDLSFDTEALTDGNFAAGDIVQLLFTMDTGNASYTLGTEMLLYDLRFEYVRQ